MRIRYNVLDSTSKISTRVYTVNGKGIQVLLEEGANTFKLVDAATKDVVATGVAKTSAKLKMAAKKALEGMGYSFESETRVRNAS